MIKNIRYLILCRMVEPILRRYALSVNNFKRWITLIQTKNELKEKKVFLTWVLVLGSTVSRVIIKMIIANGRTLA